MDVGRRVAGAGPPRSFLSLVRVVLHLVRRHLALELLQSVENADVCGRRLQCPRVGRAFPRKRLGYKERAEDAPEDDLPNKPSSLTAVITTALVAGGTELLQKVPGGTTTLAVVQTVVRRSAQQRATELFTAIGVATGAADPEEAAERLAPHIEEPWCQEAIEAGFRALMDSTDPAVRACLAILVAEYVVMQKPPDLKFRRAGAVLQDTSGSSLPTLLAITGGYVQAIAKAKPGLRVLIRDEPQAGAPDTFWVAASQEAGGMLFGPTSTVTAEFEDCTRALVSGGAGRLWAGLSDAQFKGNPLVAFDPADDEVMKLLDVCIRTSAQTTAKTRTAADE
jgi:hypothetical protein